MTDGHPLVFVDPGTVRVAEFLPVRPVVFIRVHLTQRRPVVHVDHKVLAGK